MPMALVLTRHTLLRNYQRSAELRKAEYWGELEKHCSNGPP
jgi:hypothetical protein